MKLRPVLTASALGGLMVAANTVPAFADEIETDTSVLEAEVTDTAVADSDIAPADEIPTTSEESTTTETQVNEPEEPAPVIPELSVETEPGAAPSDVEVEPEVQIQDPPAEAVEPPIQDPVELPNLESQETEPAPSAAEELDHVTVEEPVEPVQEPAPTADNAEVASPEPDVTESADTDQTPEAIESTDSDETPEANLSASAQNATAASAQDVTASDIQQVTVAAAQALAEALVGSNIEILNVTYTGHEQAAGLFNGFEDAIGIDAGIILSTGYADHQYTEDGTIQYRAVLYGPNDSGSTTGSMGTDGDEDLAALVEGSTRDAAVLEIEFIPTHDTIAFNYVFGSEEYLEYVGTSYNDVFAFFVNGVNYATLEDGTVVSVNNINHELNEDYFRNNPVGEGAYDTGLDGMTVVLSFEAPVNPGVANILKMAIADVGDAILDSAVMIQAGSFTSPVPNTPPVADDIHVEMDSMEPVVIVLTGSDADGDELTYHIVSTEHLAGTLTLDGATVVFTPQAGFFGYTTFSYLVNDGIVDSDVAYVLIFVPGDGEVPEPTEPGEQPEPSQPGEQPDPTEPGGYPGSDKQPTEPEIQPVQDVLKQSQTDWVAKIAQDPRALYVHESTDEVVTTDSDREMTESSVDTALPATGSTLAPFVIGGALMLAVGAGLMFWRRVRP